MNKTAVLMIGNDQTKLHHSISLINSNTKCDAASAAGTEDAIEKFHQRDFSLVVFTNGVQEEEKKLRKIFTLQNPRGVIIQSSDDDVLMGEIKEALEKQEAAVKPSFSIVDDALKNAMLPVTVQ
jgi:hypothetical protein